MKLTKTTHGPVALSNIEYAPRMSEETCCFVATIAVDGVGKCEVRNEGRGGDNWINDEKVRAAIEDYAATLPPDVSEYGTLAISADLLVSIMIGDAISAHEVTKMRRKLHKKIRGLNTATQKRYPFFLVGVSDGNYVGDFVANDVEPKAAAAKLTEEGYGTVHVFSSATGKAVSL